MIGGTITAGVTAIGTKAITVADGVDKSAKKIASATGEGAASVEKFKNVVKNVYGDNFGDSFEGIADDVSKITQNLGKMNEQQLIDVTERAYTLRDAFDFGVDESSRAAKAMAQNFGISIEQAYDYMAKGAQDGLNYSGELLDNISEYSVQFAKLGLSADDMFNIFKDGAENGAWNLDKIGDAVKEVAIRMVDGSQTTKEGFEALGMDAEATAAKIAQGGDVARETFKQVMAAIAAMDDPVAQNQAGVNLLGTMWEDLGATAVEALAGITDEAYHKRVSVKLGDGLDFDANNALIASMKPATSSAIGGVKAGTNITIAEDGTISTPSYVGTDGVQITSGGTSRTVRLLTGNGLTFVDGKLTAFLGKNLKFSAGGEIESEFAVKSGIVFTNDESYKFIHNISEVLYQDSDYEVMTGAQDSFILNKELVYGEGKTAPNGVTVNTTTADSPSGIPDIPVKKDRFYLFDKACYFRSPSYEEITAIDLVHISSSASMNYDRYATRITFADGTTLNINSFDNYDKYSGYGMALLWSDIYPPESTFGQTAFENGCVKVQPAYRHKGGGTDPYRFTKIGNPLVIGFASEEEYYAAMGLVYGTVDLTDLVDDPESSGGSGSINTGDSYKSPTVSLQRTTAGGRGAVKITVEDVLGAHTSYVYDGDVVQFTSQLTNDSGFIARKSGVPYNVIAIPGANSAVLVWEKVAGAAKYRVQRLNNNVWSTIAFPTANSYQATGLTEGTEYAYRVLASMDGTTWGGASEVACVTPFSAARAASISGISGISSDEFEGEEATTT